MYNEVKHNYPPKTRIMQPVICRVDILCAAALPFAQEAHALAFPCSAGRRTSAAWRPPWFCARRYEPQHHQPSVWSPQSPPGASGARQGLPRAALRRSAGLLRSSRRRPPHRRLQHSGRTHPVLSLASGEIKKWCISRKLITPKISAQYPIEYS